MAENNIQTTVLTVDTSGAKNAWQEYKSYLDELKGELVNLEKGTDEYKSKAQELRDAQQKLNEVMDVAKGKGEAVEGSYDNLSKTMSELKKQFKATGDEAERTKLALKINEINDQLKTMDASVGVYSRNVGNYQSAFEEAFKNVLGELGNVDGALGTVAKTTTSLIPVIKKATTAATTGLKGVKAALASTGIGLLIVALGLLVENWDKVTEAISRFIPGMKKANEETKAQVQANNELIESNKANNEEIDFQVRLMQAQGKSTLEILAYKKAETEALLANTEAQIGETTAKIESLKAHSAWHRFWHGENKQIKQLEESLKALTAEQESLSKAITRVNQDIQIEEINIRRTGKAAETAANNVRALADALDALRRREKRDAALEGIRDEWNRQTQELSAQLDEETQSFISSVLNPYTDELYKMVNAEGKLFVAREDFVQSFGRSTLSVLGSVSDAWMSTVQAQMDAGKMSEKEGKKQFEKIKALQTAEAVINTIAGAVGVLMGISKDTGGWGIAAAIAEATALLTAGFAQVKKIQNTTIGGASTASSSIPNIGSVTQDIMPTYTQNITNQMDIDNLSNALAGTMKGVNLSVSVTDIDNAQNKVRTREIESSY